MYIYIPKYTKTTGFISGKTSFFVDLQSTKTKGKRWVRLTAPQRAKPTPYFNYIASFYDLC